VTLAYEDGAAAWALLTWASERPQAALAAARKGLGAAAAFGLHEQLLDGAPESGGSGGSGGGEDCAPGLSVPWAAGRAAHGQPASSSSSAAAAAAAAATAASSSSSSSAVADHAAAQRKRWKKVAGALGPAAAAGGRRHVPPSDLWALLPPVGQWPQWARSAAAAVVVVVALAVRKK